MNWICSQIGAREHYAVARALHRTGRLGTLYTDFWAEPVVRGAARWIPAGRLRSMAGRYHQELDGSRRSEARSQRAEIVSWNWRALAWEARLRGRADDRRRRTEGGTPNSGFNNHYRGFIEVGRRFACAVRDRLNRDNPSVQDTLFFGYDTGALEALEWCREHGIPCIVDQMDPNRVEVKVVQAEEKIWPGWAARATEVPEEYFQRREEEWKLADRIVVNSRWSAEALVKQGVPAEKLAVVPLCYEVGRQNAEGREQKLSTFNFQPSTEKPLRVLFLGQVILRKGIQYLVEAAKLLLGEPVCFDVVGPVGISDEALRSAPANMTFHGRANRDEAMAWYERSDVFVLPTLSDGFAITQIEAMAHGLPVIVTPNCGEVVSDGLDGFLVPARDAVALAEVIRRLLAGPELMNSQRIAALKKSRQFTLERLGERLVALEQGLKTETSTQKPEAGRRNIQDRQ
jgi:glycosyltransferase involved in cell wall biosynthesis